MRTIVSVPELRIKTAMRLLGITLEDLARELGVTRPAIAQDLQRADRLRPETREKVLEALRRCIDVEAVWGGGEER